MSDRTKTANYRRCYITDGQGNDASGGQTLQSLLTAASQSVKRPWLRALGVGNSSHQLLTYFSLPVRPFIKKYATGLSGPKKFTLLVARLVDKDLKKDISLVEIEKVWNSMTALMGMDFNRFFSQQAKDNDWVETKKKGIYTLRPSWVEILKHA